MRIRAQLSCLAVALLAHQAYGVTTVGTHSVFSPPSPSVDGVDAGSPQGHSAISNGFPGKVGESVDVINGAVVRRETDFSIPVKYGFTFDLTRTYSSNPGAYTSAIRSGSGMFGCHWFCSWETHITDPTGDPLNLTWYDEQGNAHDLVKSSGVWYSKAGQSHPYRLDKVVSGTTTYVLTGHDRSVRVFATDGKILSYRKDKDTYVNEVITFNYDGSSPRRLLSIDAPGTDDRRLVFNYYSSPYQRQVSNVTLEAGTTPNSYVLSSYIYDTDKRLTYAKGQGPDIYTLYWVAYEYGSMNSSAVWTGASGADTPLARISYYANGSGTQRFVTAYEANSVHGFADREFVYNPTSSTWVCTLVYDFLSTREVNYGTGGSAPQTVLTGNYRGDPLESTFSNLTSGTNVTPLVNLGPGVTTPSTGYGSSDTEPRLIGSVRRFDGTNYFPIEATTYSSLSDSNTLLRFRPASHTVYKDTSTGMTTSYTYDSTYPERIATVTLPTSEVTTVGYYATSTSNGYSARVDYVTRGGLTTSYDYNSDGLIDDITDPWSNVTAFTYDIYGNVLTVTKPDNSVITRTYNDFGQVKTEAVTHLGTTTYAYSNDAKLTDGTTNVPSGEVFLPPRVIEAKDALGKKTRFYYDTRGYQTSVVDDDGGTVSYTYDNRGRRIEVSNQNSETSQFDYDNYDRLVTFRDGEGKETDYSYDEFGRVIEEEDYDGFTRSVRYSDGQGAGVCACSGGGENIVSRIEQQNGRFIHLEYDLAGRLSKVWYSANGTLNPTTEVPYPHITYTYDNSGRVLSIVDTRLGLGSGGQANKYSFTYDSGSSGSTGYLTKVTHPEGYTQEYFFNATTKLAEAYKDTDGYVQSYSYDALKKLSTLVDGYGSISTWTYATTSDTSFPVGAAKRLQYGNGTKNDYTYDTLARLDRVEYLTSASAVFDYVDLAYSDIGLITEKERKDPSGTYWKMKYEYDAAYRLAKERTYNASNTEKNRLEYAYDLAGNRSSLVRTYNNMISSQTTSYTYGDRNEVLTDNGHYGSSAMTYDYDDKGNMESRVTSSAGWFYEWNDDNKMVVAYHKPSLLSGTRDIDQTFVHDAMLKRVLQRDELTDVRTRYFFNGLTEEVTRQSVGTGADNSFEFTTVFDGTSKTGWAQAVGTGATISENVTDSDRHSSVLTFVDNDSCSSRFDVDPADTTPRVLSLWHKRSVDCGAIVVSMQTSAGTRYLTYNFGTGTNAFSSPTYTIYLGNYGSFPSGQWNRFERDLQADITSLTGGVTYVKTYGYWLWGRDFRIDDLRVSSSLSIEHNTLGRGSLAHILRNRTINPSTFAVTDRWFHYDQVGSIMAESNSAGASAQLHYQDAFGNAQSGWSAGLPGGIPAGWHHNTKAYSSTLGFVQMGQRGYLPELGTFMSSAPYPTMLEHRYNFVVQNPSLWTDSSGRQRDGGVQLAGPVQNYPDPSQDDWMLYDDYDPNVSVVREIVHEPVRDEIPTPTPTPAPTPTPPVKPSPENHGGWDESTNTWVPGPWWYDGYLGSVDYYTVSTTHL